MSTILLPLVILSLLQEPGLGPPMPPESAAKTLAHCREGLTRLEAALQQVRAGGHYREKITRPGLEKPVREREYEISYARLGSLERWVSLTNSAPEGGKSAYQETIILGDADRVFTITRDSASDPYRLASTDEAKPTNKTYLLLRRNADRFVMSPVMLGDISLDSVLNSRNFDAKQVRQLVVDGRELVRVDFVCSGTGKPGDPGQEGWFVVDPTLGWAVREFEATPMVPDASTFHGSVEYVPAGGSPPRVERASLESRSKNGARFIFHCVFSEYRYTSTPAREFSPASFGLGDVDAPPRPTRNTTPYWFFAVAIIALCLSFYLRRVWRSRS